MSHRHLKRGFTLTELLVVVALIGILSSIAVPAFRKYIAKSRTAEAKMSLATIFVAEATAYADFGTYVTCLCFLGVEHTQCVLWAVADADPNFTLVRDSRYYTAGFSTFDGNAAWGNAYVRANFNSGCDILGGGGPTCSMVGIKTTSACAGRRDLAAASIYSIATSGTSMTQSTYVAMAYGYMGNCNYPGIDDRNIDIWNMDQTKRIRHIQMAY